MCPCCGLSSSRSTWLKSLIAASAAGAFGQTREEVSGAAPVVHGADVGHAAVISGERILLLPRFDGVPEFVIEDAKLGRFLDNPFRFRVGPSLPLAGVRILDEALPVPDDLADIH